MGLLSRKSDPIADAQAVVDKLQAQHARLADRLSGAQAASEAAQGARQSALVDGDPDVKAMAALDSACSRAMEAQAGIEHAISAVAAQLEEAREARDALQDAARRSEIAISAEERANALDQAAEGLARAARGFAEAREAMTAAIAEHGVRSDNVLSISGVPPTLLVKPVIQAAVRLAAPDVLPMIDGFGNAYDADPALMVRRGQSGRLRDHADDVRSGSLPAVELPRPSATPAPIDPNDPFAAKVPMVRGSFREPFSYLATGGRLTTGEPGAAEVPAEVLRIAVEMGIAAEPGTPEAREILQAVKADAGRPPYLRARPGAPGTVRRFVDTDEGVVSSGVERSATWPNADRVERRA